MKKRFAAATSIWVTGLASAFLMMSVGITAGVPALAGETAALDEAGWEVMDEDDGVTVWRKEVPGSPIVAFKGNAVIDAPVAKVANVLYDTKRKLEWVANAEEAEDVKFFSPLDRIEYNHTGTPVVLRDRDFLFRALVEIDKANQTILISMKSVEDPAKPEQDCCIRGKLHQSRYILKSIEGGKKTDLTVEIFADPMGSVAKWIVNLFQKNWPKNTLKNIKKQVAKEDVVEHRELAAYLNGSMTEPEYKAYLAGKAWAGPAPQASSAPSGDSAAPKAAKPSKK